MTTGTEPGNNRLGNLGYREVLDTAIADTFLQAAKMVVADPARALTGTRMIWHQKNAAALRLKFEQQGLLVPPVMMVSITSQCNLACQGCYMHRQPAAAPVAPGAEMSPKQIHSITEQAADLGISVIVLAGGEPLLRKNEILTLARAFPHILFPIFTNGLLIDDDTAKEIAGTRNIVPVISFEGLKEDTDLRRGNGVYDRLLGSCARLAVQHVFFGCSVTVTSKNLPRVTSTEFIRHMIGAGVRVFVFVEYVPVKPGTESLVLSKDHQKILLDRITGFSRDFPALFIGFPGDEARYGGCLAAGRGFIHISPRGDLEPCPAAPFSDANLTTRSLRDALQSRFLAQLRDHHDCLTETQGGCALWTNREWVSTLLERS